MEQNAAAACALAGAGGWRTQAAFKVARVFIGFAHIVSAALGALGHGQHIVVNKFHQTPSSGDGQQGLYAA